MQRKPIEKGTIFNRWTTIKEIAPKGRNRYIRCKCECGTIRNVLLSSLKNEDSKSCGCLQKERAKETFTTHGLYKTHLYRVYKNMISRCYSDKHISYPNYGGRGIKVCKEWRGERGLLKFIKWNTELPTSKQWKEGCELDRKNNNKHYTPDNCRWISVAKNRANGRRTVKVFYNGKEYSIIDLYQKRKDKSLPYKTFYSRIRERGWSVAKALREPYDLTCVRI